MTEESLKSYQKKLYLVSGAAITAFTLGIGVECTHLFRNIHDEFTYDFRIPVVGRDIPMGACRKYYGFDFNHDNKIDEIHEYRIGEGFIFPQYLRYKPKDPGFRDCEKILLGRQNGK